MEIGTFDGRHAAEFIEAAKLYYSPKDIYYYGFDLFELLDDEKLKSEASKRPSTMDAVRKRLSKTGAQIQLYQGDTKETLPRIKNDLGKLDFIFLDGGHSYETIISDWNIVKTLMDKKTTVIFDDFYSNYEPEISGLGCQDLIRNLDTNTYDIQILDPMNRYVKEWGILKINLVKVTKKY